ncbi:hypothetical protein H045_16990 [Pseudomonas poae RE*1-1-14]|nr:hypothetical protein H045_16990 [Pseudomonas poae RE*1-1-14]
MTTATERSNQARKTFLLSLKQAASETALMREMLQQMQDQTPDLFDAHLENEAYAALDNDAYGWSDGYFTRQIFCAEQNFSIARLGHLITVREHFRQQGRKGFAPKQVQETVEPPVSQGSNFTPSKNLQVFVGEGDLLTIRTALHLELNVNHNDSQTLRESLKWVLRHKPDLCDAYEEKTFARGIDLDRGNWTADYFNTQEVYLDTNFCEKRFLHLIEVRESLRQKGVKGFVSEAAPVLESTPARAPAAPHASGRQQQHTPPYPPARGGLNPVLKAALLVGGALAALVVLIVSMAK